MGNEKEEPEEVKEVKEILAGTQVPKEGDKISRREIAESFARLDGDTSEAGVQKQLKFMDWLDAGKKTTPNEKRYLIVGWLVFLSGVALPGVVNLFGYKVNVFVFLTVIVLGFVLVLVGEEKRNKRVRNLPRPPS